MKCFGFFFLEMSFGVDARVILFNFFLLFKLNFMLQWFNFWFWSIQQPFDCLFCFHSLPCSWTSWVHQIASSLSSTPRTHLSCKFLICITCRRWTTQYDATVHCDAIKIFWLSPVYIQLSIPYHRHCSIVVSLHNNYLTVEFVFFFICSI